ncbi:MULTISPECIES: helix-turn-helix domain-containing protein [unclassified Variovorax]|uniref:helix-turn-helix domain-containing protein n=1 Tax=unclassified Variovorax TaxID=663243 RepID=UPI003F47A7AD
MSTSLDLAQRLEAARLASGLTRQQLTEQASVSRQAVYRLFKGNDVQVSTLLAVMEVLQLDLATVPRALKRGLPELGLSDAALPPGSTGAMPAASPGNSSHVLSAVQRRLASLKEGGAAPVTRVARATRKSRP